MKSNGSHYKYRSILLDLKNRVRGGDWNEADFLPSEQSLATYYNVGRNTIRRALAELAACGLIWKAQGCLSRVQGGGVHPQPAAVPERKCVYLTSVPLAALDASPVYLELFQMLAQLCRDRRWELDLISLCDSKWFERYSAYPYAAAFINGCDRKLYSMQDFQRLQELPNLIVLDNTGDQPWKYTINPDHRASAALAVKHLIANGRKKIGFFCTKQAYTSLYKSFAERQEGYELAMKEAGLPFSEKNICIIRVQQLNFLLDVLRQEKRLLFGFDAIFAVTDLLAVLLTQVAQEENIRVPEDLAIIGFDGWKVAQLISPRIATVRQPMREIALAAFDLAMKLADGGELPPREINLPGILIPGETVSFKRQQTLNSSIQQEVCNEETAGNGSDRHHRTRRTSGCRSGSHESGLFPERR